jgi:hypothetical protein
VDTETAQAESSLKLSVISNEKELEIYLENTEEMAKAISETDIIQNYIYYLNKDLNDSEKKNFEDAKTKADNLIKSFMEVHWGKYHHFYIVNTLGEIILSPEHSNYVAGSPPSHLGSSLADIRWFPLSLNETQVTDFSSLSESDHYHQLLLYPIKDQSGKQKQLLDLNL